VVRRSGKGIGWAIAAGVGFGVLFWLLGFRIIPRVGASQAVWMIRLTSSVLGAAAILVAKEQTRLPWGDLRWMALSMGCMDTGAFVLSNHGMQMEQVSVISVLGSLYGFVTVALAAIFLREHVSRWQWFGIVTIFAGIFLISR
jgi:drug/metabolite transporter (DMT)-like permease